MRELKGPIGWFVATVAVAIALFQLYTGGFGPIEPREQRSVHLGVLLALAFILFPATKASPRDRPTAIDCLFALLAVIPNIYSYVEAHRINLRLENVDALTTGELWNGIIATLLIVEALRRAVTPVLAILLSTGIG